jgi:hypothetical protein
MRQIGWVEEGRISRKIAGDSKDEAKLQFARAIAEAVLDLERVRRAKVSLNRMHLR